jgi:hypothetical protein
MKNDIDLDSLHQGLREHRDGSQTSPDITAPELSGTELALVTQLELSRHREAKARTELQQVRADSARVTEYFEVLLDDVEKRLRIQVEIKTAEQDHLERIVADLEASSIKAKSSLELQREEYSAHHRRLLLQIAELEATEGILRSEQLVLKNEIDSYSRTLIKKESYGRDKARRLDTALNVLAQERSKIRSLQESSSMKIGRLITRSLKNPASAFALIWRLPRLIYLETKMTTWETKK